MTRTHLASLLAALAALLVVAGRWGSRQRSAPPPAASTNSSEDKAPPLLASSAEPDELFSALASDPAFQELAQSGAPFSLSYSHRPFGELKLTGARLTPSDSGAFQIRAEALAWASAAWRELDFSVRRRVEMIELFPTPADGIKPIAVSYTKGRSAALWGFTLPHQPARAALAHYAPELAPEDELTRLLVSLSLVVPHDADKPVSGQLELVLDNWSKPEWPDAGALFGDTLSLGGRVGPNAGRAIWPLEDVRISTLLFSLSGRGQIEWRRTPALRLDAAGTLTCQQLGKNLAPSVYLEDVQHFLASATPAERAGKVELSLHLDLDSVEGRREQVFRLGGGCGLAAR